MIVFSCFAPHPPLLLPDVGSEEDRAKVKGTIESLEQLGKGLKEADPDQIVISSPHPDWGVKVPLHFLISKIKNQKSKKQFKIQKYQSPADVVIGLSDSPTIWPVITTLDSTYQHFEWGREFYLKIANCKLKISLVASGDLSHRLKKGVPMASIPMAQSSIRS